MSNFRLVLAVQLALGLTFLGSASSKLLEPVGFAYGVAEYHVLPKRFAYGIGIAIIATELALAASHLSGLWLIYAIPVSIVMLVAFGLAVAVNISRGVVLPCYCFGVRSTEPVSYRVLVRIALLLSGEVVLLKGAAQSQIAASHHFVDHGIALMWATGIVMCCLWILSAPDVIGLVRASVTRTKQRQG